MQPKKEKPLIVIHKDEINVVYILRLLAKFTEANTPEEKEKQRTNITNILNSNPQLRSKRELIEEFIDTTLEGINPDDIEEEYDKFLEVEKEKALNELIEKENLHRAELINVVDTYLYDGRKPLSDDIAKTLQVKPKLLEQKR
jgi:type I restriction enzyme R subunit